jgi:hypothetical protein
MGEVGRPEAQGILVFLSSDPTSFLHTGLGGASFTFRIRIRISLADWPSRL